MAVDKQLKKLALIIAIYICAEEYGVDGCRRVRDVWHYCNNFFGCCPSSRAEKVLVGTVGMIATASLYVYPLSVIVSIFYICIVIFERVNGVDLSILNDCFSY